MGLTTTSEWPERESISRSKVNVSFLNGGIWQRLDAAASFRKARRRVFECDLVFEMPNHKNVFCLTALRITRKRMFKL